MMAGRSDRGERIVFIVLSTVVFAYIAARAVLVPVIHDEAMTFFLYVEPGKFLPFLSHWDAGNHLLCSALAWISYSVFGFHAWALRLPCVLAFVLYAAYAWRWGTRLSEPVVRWCFWAAWSLMPFLLDFFSLFRGYGLAMAFWSMALYELCALLENASTKRLVAVLVATACATFSSLSLLTLWVAVLAIAAIVILCGRLPRKAIAVWLCLGLAPFLFAAAYVHELSQRGNLYYGVPGLLDGTVPSLLKAMFGTTNAVAVAVVLILLLVCSLVAFRVIRGGERSFAVWALAVGAGFLWLDAAGRIVLHAWNGTLFPEDRTALQWVLLFILLIAFTMDRLAYAKPELQWAALLLLVFPARTIATANFITTGYWPQQAIPASIYHAVDRLQRFASRPLTIGAYHQMPACWGFGLRERGMVLNAVDVSEFPHGGEDLLIINPNKDTVPADYRAVAMASSGYVALYEREGTRSFTLLLDSILPPLHGDAEFRELWHPPIGSVQGKSFLLELDLSLHPGDEPMTGDLAVVTDAPGTGQHDDHVLLQFMRDPARSDSIHTLRHIPSVPMDATRIVVFLWNPMKQPYSSSGRIRIYSVEGHYGHAHP